ncbi:MAG: hypothetical protein N3B16_04235 [Candidatus Aminicenantes bacterium]|nr:hypothetical protein [Candidatus Aminicenantes bacterium]
MKMNQKIFLILLMVMFALVPLLVLSSDEGPIDLLSKKSRAEKLWKISGHANKNSTAFNYWNTASPAEIPATCAKCHSTPGFLDFIGADGSTPNQVDKNAPVGTTVECSVCHTDTNVGTLRARPAVVFPSGVEVKGLGPEGLCMECHQGRSSTVAVDTAIANAGAPTDDTPRSALSFLNIHYYAAAASQFGTIAKGGYQYGGKTYDARFVHLPGYNACITCHNPHSLQVDLMTCNTCHPGIKDPKNIRYWASMTDYDGDGDIAEGIYYEIADLQNILYELIKKYARDVAGLPIVYDERNHPFFFIDKNDNGRPDSDEVTSANRYNAFTPRLLRAAYNLQVSKKDPAGFAHNAKYHIELLYDSIEDLNSKLNNYVDMARFHRTDEGHFDGSSIAWRNWDSTGTVPSTCAKCHTAEGLPYFLEKGTMDISLPSSNGLLCTTCHTSPPLLRKIGPVTFPSGLALDLKDSSNFCLHCHQGRAAKTTVDATIAGSAGPYTFINIHYYPTAAVFFGSEAKGGYEFSNKVYASRRIYPNHLGRFDTCTECHMGLNSPNRTRTAADMIFHNVSSPQPKDCVSCHGQDIAQPHPGADPEKFTFSGIRPASTPDYDGDGNRNESIQSEITDLEKALYSQMRTYSAARFGLPLVYNKDVFPYFFRDLNNNGMADPEELTTANRYLFDAPLLRAAYNYQVSKKDPCGYIHNSLYIAQLLVDSIEHLGGNIARYSWR